MVDASATLSWLLADERDNVAIGMLQAIVVSRAFVPALWRWEVQSGLLSAERRKRITPDDAASMIEDLVGLDIEIDTAERLEMGAELTLARKFSLSAYDASYLDLAIRKNLKLMTRDEKLANAADQMGLLWTR